MKGQIVTGQYMPGGNIRLYVRTEDGERTYVDVSGFEPYGGCLASESIPNHPAIVRTELAPPDLITGAKLVKVIYKSPDLVGGKHGFHTRNFYPHWESDINFIDRFMIDKGLTSGIEFYRGGSSLHHTDVIPDKFSLPPVKVGWDIECYSEDRIPDPEHPDQKITALSFWSNTTNHYDSILLDDMNKVSNPAEDWTIYHLKSEKDVLNLGLKYLAKIQPDVLFEWGALDEEYFPPRAERHDLDISIFKKMNVFNMIEAYKTIYKKGSNRLKDVAYDEGIIDYIPREYDFADTWDNDRFELILKNKLDVEWMVKINQLKGDLVTFFWNLKNYSGLSGIQEATWHGQLVDNQLLRRYHGKYMMPSRPNKEEQEKRPKLLGAIIKTPPTGLFEDIAVIDFSRYYQNLLIGILGRRNDPRLDPLVDLAQELQNVRDEYDKKLEDSEIDSDEYHVLKGTRDSVKYVGEAVIGYLGGKRSRWYNPEAFEAVIKTGRNGLLHADDLCVKLGYKVHYYDTDGLDVQVKQSKDKQAVVDDSWDLTHILNDKMSDWAEEQGIDKTLKFKVDQVAARVLYSGKKKRSARHVIWEDGDFCDYMLVKGFEYIRRDSSLITRNVQREVFEHLLRRGMTGLRSYLNTTIKDIKSGKYKLREVSLSKGIKHSWKYYARKGKTPPQHVRGSLWANKHLDAKIQVGDQVKMIYVLRTPGYPSTDVVCFLDEDIIPDNFVIDWGKMIERTIERKVGQYIEQGGLQWGEVMGMKKLSGVFA